MYSSGPFHMDEQRQDDQLEPTYSSSMPIQDVVLKTSRKQWTIEKGGVKGSGISVLKARHEDDDILLISAYFNIYIWLSSRVFIYIIIRWDIVNTHYQY